MNWVLIFLFSGVLLAYALRELWLARPESGVSRFHVRSIIVDVEPLQGQDVFRSHPYWVTIRPLHSLPSLVLPEDDLWMKAQQSASKRNSDSLPTTTCYPSDLNLGKAREAMSGKLPVETWISTTDPQDVRFKEPGGWDTHHLVIAMFTILLLPAVLLSVFANRNLVLSGSLINVFIYLSAVLICAILLYFGTYFLVRILSHQLTSFGTPLQVESRITGVYQDLKTTSRRAGTYVHLMWQPNGLPVQYGRVHLLGYSRRRALILEKLIDKQLEDESNGKIRVPVTHHQPATKTTTLFTSQGPTTITVTRMDSPPLDPRTQAARRAALRAVEKRQKQLRKEQERWEAKTRKAHANAVKQQVEYQSEEMKNLLEIGPTVWYHPLSPGTPHLVGLSAVPNSPFKFAIWALFWTLIALAGLSSLIYLIWINPEFMFPVNNVVYPSQDLPLGKWK